MNPAPAAAVQPVLRLREATRPAQSPTYRCGGEQPDAAVVGALVDRARGAEQVRQLLDSLHPAIRATQIRVDSGVPGTWVSRVLVGDVRLDRLRSRGRIELGIEACPVVWVGRVRAGTLACTQAGGTTNFGSGDMFLAHCPHVPWSVTSKDLVADLAVFDEDSIRAVAAVGCPVRGPVSARVAHRWWRTFDYVQEIITADPRCEPHVAATLERLLIMATTEAFTPDRLPTAHHDQATEPYLQIVQRAVALIEADPGADLTITDLAAAAGVSGRSVQLAFRRALGTTPMNHLRGIRLQRVHQDLAHADPQLGHTVSAAAARWGFTSPGRFAALYRSTYGRPPSHTLHRPNGGT